VELIRLDDPWQRAFYENECLRGNWSVRQLQRQIGSLLYERTALSTDKEAVIEAGRAQAPEALTTLAGLIRDPYVLEFTGLAERPHYRESDLETALLDHLQSFLLELGSGFCFEARQKRITLGNEHDYIDLVFYHRRLRCHVLIELKVRAFQHGDAGQMNFYLNYWKANEVAEGDNPPVGLLLCSDKDATKVEYATAGLDRKVFVSRYLVALPPPEQLRELIETDRAALESRGGASARRAGGRGMSVDDEQDDIDRIATLSRSDLVGAAAPPTRQAGRLAGVRADKPARSGPAASTPTAAPGTVFSPHPLVLKLEPRDQPRRSLNLSDVLAVVQHWREAILAHSNGLPERVRGVLSGHEPGGAPTDKPHLTFLPLASVGYERADGRLLAMALVLPADMLPDDRRVALRAIRSVQRLVLGRLGAWNIVPQTTTTHNLRPQVWNAQPDGATHWSTVTPVAFDRHPKADSRGEHQREAAAMIATACTRVGLPEPREVIVTQISAHLGVPPSFAFPRLRRKDNSERRHTHAILEFDRPVCGPILIGAGRYRGYGVCRAIGERGAP
jgi:predicted nuclease of restriction endonuclease-like (RecB) superfamily